jgi:hypothetical protein
MPQIEPPKFEGDEPRRDSPGEEAQHLAGYLIMAFRWMGMNVTDKRRDATAQLVAMLREWVHRQWKAIKVTRTNTER